MIAKNPNFSGNSWGVDKSGQGCVGCGEQEQFYGCSDIAIGKNIRMLYYSK